ncbi:MAG TPA: NAD(P)-dependent oxidoreductase, partial [Flavobacterium sp.]|nr:NAD(P)-dependent oxidoreductase [Flavobacterium sp.]
REENRGFEIEGKTIGIIGYGNMGKAFAQRLKGFNCTVICYDIKPNVGDQNARQVSLEYLQLHSDILSLHTPQTESTQHLINKKMIDGFAKSFWFINTARGKSVETNDLVEALKSGKIKGAGLDVLEYEKASFENMFSDNELPEAFQYLIKADNVLLSPHIAGWTIESKEKLAQIIVDKVIGRFTDKQHSATESQHQNYTDNWQTQSSQQQTYQSNQEYYNQQPYQNVPQYLRDANSKKILAGIMGIVFGYLGVHKFVLGYTGEGILMLLTSILIVPILGLMTCGMGWGLFIFLPIIPFVEGIIYLTKTDQDFYHTYIKNKRGWF